ncbi:HD-GYP domain-containing protein [Hippea sp. KM1]|uniref:HD-GYP domain-containing protein n=1 Tax=Hippea sp. KM1 TaxID=944481 RepID=UPI00046D1C56|nr:HD domain-containing phosphohydrolase [Hippea sp. KM1]
MVFYKKFNLSRLVENLSKSLDLILNGSPSNHALRVSFICILISYQMNFKLNERINLYLAGLLHDIGAVERETQLLLEYDKRDCVDLQRHAIVGYEILKKIPLFEEIALIVKDHHNPASNNLLSRIIYFADEVEVLLRRENLFEPKTLKAKIYPLYKNRPMFSDILDAFVEVIRNDAFFIMLSNVEEIKKYFVSHVEEKIVSVDAELFNRLAKSIAESFIDKKSKFTLTHSSDVAKTALAIARQVGLSNKDCKTIETAGFLHDIGKLFVPKSILEYPGKLSGNDWLRMKSHVYYTYSFLNQMELDEDIIHIASSHHEYLDGSGYPFGLNRNDLSTGAQILTVADIYSALRQKRPYRSNSFSHQEALEVLIGMANKGKINRDFIKAIPSDVLDI